MAKVKAIGKEGEGGVLEVADTTPYLESGKYELYNAPATDPVVSTDGIRDNMAANRVNAADALNDTIESGSILDGILETYNDGIADYTKTAKEGESELADMAKSLGILNPQEEQQVQDAGESAYSQYLPLIQDAEEGKRRGLPKATIGAGERGGFMSTQFAGGAALQQTEGGDFFGEGGALNQIKSDYDRNILLANSEAKRARLLAEAAERKAIKTGKREDYEIARQAKESAKQNILDVINLNQKKADAIYQYSQFQQNAVTFRNSLEDRDRAIENEDEDRRIAAEDRLKEQAANQFNSAMDFLGIDGIKNNQTQLENMFKEAGFTDIKFNDVVAQFEALEEAARLAGVEKPELRSNGNQLLALTWDAETGQYKTQVVATSSSGGGGGGSTTKVSTGVRNDLIGGGFTEDQVSDVDAWIKENGVEAALSDPGLTDQQKQAIRKAYNVPQEKTETLDQKLNNLGFSPEERRLYKTETENSQSSIDPMTWLNNYRASKKSSSSSSSNPFE